MKEGDKNYCEWEHIEKLNVDVNKRFVLLQNVLYKMHVSYFILFMMIL